MESSRLNRLFSRSASSRSMPSRCGCSRSRFRYKASSPRVEKSSSRSSPSAVRRIQSGMACSERGQIKRFKVIASVKVQTRGESPARPRMASRPSWRHIWCPTCTGPASRASSISTWSTSMVTVESEAAVDFFPRTARRLSRSTSAATDPSEACPSSADSILCASPSQCSAGAGSKLPSEQMVRWRGPWGVCTDSTRR